MKKIPLQILLGLFMAAVTHADTPLTVGVVSYGIGGPCWDDTLVVPNPPSASGTFTLPGVSGTGVVSSAVGYVVDNLHGQQHLHYIYSVDMSGMSAPSSHCIRLLAHFGTPHTCAYDVLVLSGPGVQVSSAIKAAFGDITFAFNSGCLLLSQKTAPFGMLTDVQPKTNVVTVIDDYVNPANGQTNEARVNVTAVVPDIPPDWAYAPQPIPNVFFQGSLVTNPVPNAPRLNGSYDLALQLVDSVSNGLPVGPVSTQTVQVVNGLFNLPLPFDPISMGDGSVRWLSMGVRPSLNGGTFNALVPAVQLASTPQALYAYSAGVVADILPNQAVLSLNGITGNTVLLGGSGIQVALNGDGKTIVISQSSPSDHNIKTGFAAVKPEEILDRLLALPVQSWRYTNEIAGVRHLGPMAQDFHAAFGLNGGDDKHITAIDEGGVALAAIQGLNQKLNEKDSEIQTLKQQNEALEKRLNELETTVKSITEKK